MKRSANSRLALALFAMPLALTLASCGKGNEENGGLSGDPISKVAPPAGKSWAEVVSKTPDGGYLMGNPQAPIKLVEYGALSCSHCAEFSEKGSAELRDNFVASGRVSYELRLFMLNALDVPAALLATCGSQEAVIPLSDQFWAWQPNMFQNMQAAGEAKVQAATEIAPPGRFAGIAKVTGMDEFFAARGIAADQAKTCLSNMAEAEAMAKRTNELGERDNVTGTPTFLINGKKSEDNTWEAIKARLETMGAR
ncbi:MAG: thioredoxin domain-containing protein [Novosphingobium sp.]